MHRQLWELRFLSFYFSSVNIIQSSSFGNRRINRKAMLPIQTWLLSCTVLSGMVFTLYFENLISFPFHWRLSAPWFDGRWWQNTAHTTKMGLKQEFHWNSKHLLSLCPTLSHSLINYHNKWQIFFQVRNTISIKPPNKVIDYNFCKASETLTRNHIINVFKLFLVWLWIQTQVEMYF